MSKRNRLWLLWMIVMVTLMLLAVAFLPTFAECPAAYPSYPGFCDGGPAKSKAQGCHDLLRWKPADGATAYEVQRRGWMPVWGTVAVVQELPWTRPDTVGELCRYDTPEGERLYWFYDGEENPKLGRWRRYRVRSLAGTQHSGWTGKTGRWTPE